MGSGRVDGRGLPGGAGVMAGAHGYALFDSEVGRCGVAWGPDGLEAVQLPEVSDAETVVRLTERLADAVEMAPPAEVQSAIDQMVALLAGRASDLSTIALDMTGVPPFHRRVYQLARTIPPGGDAFLWRGGRRSRVTWCRPCRRPGVAPQSLRHRGALSSGRGRGREAGWLLGQRRPLHQGASAVAGNSRRRLRLSWASIPSWR